MAQDCPSHGTLKFSIWNDTTYVTYNKLKVMLRKDSKKRIRDLLIIKFYKQYKVSKPNVK